MISTPLILAILLFIAGVIGTIMPVLPGAILVYGGMVLYGFMTGFETLDTAFFVIQGAVLILTFGIDYIASAYGTRRYGGSKQAALGAIAGTILGLIFLGPLGIIIGPFLGAVITELVRGIEFDKALKAGIGTLIGMIGGTVVKIGAEIAMIVYFFMKI